MIRPDLVKRKALLAQMAVKRCARICHYTETLDAIEPGILPLVKALETDMTCPIYSCAGHWDVKTDPYVTFVVLPVKETAFRRFLASLLESAPERLHNMTFYHRHHPKRFGNGPFIDWKLAIAIDPVSSVRSARKYDAVRDAMVLRYADFLRKRFSRSKR